MRPFNPDAMDRAALEASADLAQRLQSMSAAERNGAALLVVWMADHFRGAGYKRLCRWLLGDGLLMLRGE